MRRIQYTRAWIRREERVNDRDFVYEKWSESVRLSINRGMIRKVSLGQWCQILLNAFHSDPWSPECSKKFGIVSWVCLWHLSIAEVCLPGMYTLGPFSAVGFLRRTCSRYLQYLLEDKISGVLHGLGGFGQIFLVTMGAWRLITVQRVVSYCWASQVALLVLEHEVCHPPLAEVPVQQNPLAVFRTQDHPDRHHETLVLEYLTFHSLVSVVPCISVEISCIGTHSRPSCWSGWFGGVDVVIPGVTSTCLVL